MNTKSTQWFVADSFTTHSCPDVVNSGVYYVMDAALPNWPADGFCRALLTGHTTVPRNYVYEVSLYNYDGVGSNAHPGILFNAQDASNFDVLFFR